MDPFLSAICEGPAMVSFSGGRTSALMLRRCLDAGLSARIGRGDVHILFANTGKERPETLDFVDEVDRRWCRPVGLSVRWLERERAIGPVRDHAARAEGRENGVTTFREVTHETAARAGEPFSQLIAERKFTPNPVARFCTQELKIRVMKAFMLSLGYEHWVNIVGMRADEPHRVSRLRAGEGRDRWTHAFPLHDAGITRNDVLLFWKKQDFDLRLRSWEGNCDACFLKGIAKRSRIFEDRPDLAKWWVEQEAKTTPFRIDCPSYGALAGAAGAQGRMFDNALFGDRPPTDDDPTDLGDCVCHD